MKACRQGRTQKKKKGPTYFLPREERGAESGKRIGEGRWHPPALETQRAPRKERRSLRDKKANDWSIES